MCYFFRKQSNSTPILEPSHTLTYVSRKTVVSRIQCSLQKIRSYQQVCFQIQWLTIFFHVGKPTILSFQFKQISRIVLHCVFSINSWYQGCIALLRYSSEAKPLENVKLLGSKGVLENCSGEACSSFEQNKCKHGGVCVDLVVKTECDCKGTGYYGRFCERSGNER